MKIWNGIACFFFSLLVLSFSFGSTLCRPIENENPIIFHARFPYFFLGMKSTEFFHKDLEFSLNQQPIAPLNESIVRSFSSSEKIVLLIDHSNQYRDLDAEGKRNHLLLEFAQYFETNPDLLFSYLVDDKIVPFDMTQKNILSMQDSVSPYSRIIDALIIANLQIKSKHPNENVLIIVIGTGKTKGNMESEVLPVCPVFYLIPEHQSLENPLISFLVEASGGKVKLIPEAIQIDEMLNYFSSHLKNFNHYIAQFKISPKNYFPRNTLLINQAGATVSIHFAMPLIYQWMLFVLIFLTLYVLGYYATKYLKRRRRIVCMKKLQHKYTPAFLLISYMENRFEVRITNCEFIIGSSKNCDCILDDFDLSASHCMIKEKDGCHEVIDLNSRNGVYVNGLKVRQCLLKHEDMIIIGSSRLIYLQGQITYVSENKIL